MWELSWCSWLVGWDLPSVTFSDFCVNLDMKTLSSSLGICHLEIRPHWACSDQGSEHCEALLGAVRQDVGILGLNPERMVCPRIASSFFLLFFICLLLSLGVR